MTDLDELIRRLEAATEGSHELDALIWDTFGPHKPRSIKRYTSSLDAALTLLPEDASWTVGKWRASVGGCVEAVYWADVHMGESFAIRHRSATIAVCIGGLKARAVLGRDVTDGYK